MTLEEAFEKYDDKTKLVRKKTIDVIYEYSKNSEFYKGKLDDLKKDMIETRKYYSKEISFLKEFYTLNSHKSVEMGFIVPKFFLEDEIANDWEVVE